MNGEKGSATASGEQGRATGAKTTSITCTNCGHHIPTTPVVNVKVVAYFTEVFKAKTDWPKLGERNNLKIRVEGEAITSDEFQQLLEEETEKRKKGKAQQKSSGKPHMTMT